MAESSTYNLYFNNIKELTLAFYPDKTSSLYSTKLYSWFAPWILDSSTAREEGQVGTWRGKDKIWKSTAIWYGG
jgi:hypothetical protein